MKKPPKSVITSIKIIISALLIYFIFSKINIKEIGSILAKAKLVYVVIALVLFSISKVIAAIRLNLYFKALNVIISHKNNFKLYLLGMFYNLFLPGGIGGDAYKGYIIKKTFNVDTKKVVSVLVLDRLSGLLLLFIYACILALYMKLEIFIPYTFLFYIGIFSSVVVFWFLNKTFFKYVLPVFWASTALSAIVQLAQLASIFMLLQALQITNDQIAYMFVFLISSIVSVLPLTIGGIGSRELTFFYGATLLQLNENVSIGVSVLFFLITAAVSLLGILYHFKKPQLTS